MASRILKIGDKFTASIVEDCEFILHDVINNWAIGLDPNNVPWCISGDDIDDETETISIILPNIRKGKK